MIDVAAALSPVFPALRDIAATMLAGVAIWGVREGVSIAQHWFHVTATAAYQASLETAATNAAGAIAAKAVTADVINKVFNVDDPHVKIAANWIVHESNEHAAAVDAIGADVDDMAHKIVSKLGLEQIKAAGAPAAVVAAPNAAVVAVDVTKPVAATPSAPPAALPAPAA